ncbi:MoeB/thiF family protein [hydrothermal vent metagenome]|uniref:MoeB/thiF family protein n=1 Tax=hydrothermal vent metagenome TaxID=652676 RepID=A0A1W1BRT9_9ZZZZ
MIPGFSKDSPLVCEGIIGDGCGGGRFFAVENETLFAYDPLTQERIILLREVKDAQKVSKCGCIITIVCKNTTLNFDLSALH